MKGVASAARIRLYLLGSFRLERDSRAINLPTRKIESLLAYLALYPEPHSRQRLAALLWGDSTDAQARHSLRTALAAIRKALGAETLLTDRESVQLVPIWVDAQEVEKLEARDTTTLQSLISDFRELLPDFYDDWIVPERERLRTIYIETLLRLVQHHREQGEYLCAIEIAQKVLSLDRANESAHQHLMLCYAAQGDRTAALKQYDECKKTLRDQLDAEPSADTTALRDQIAQELTGAPSRGAALTNLPNLLTSFIGREEEQRELQALLNKTRLLTLTGAGGCGKTRLAIQIARERVNHFNHSVWWIELAPFNDPARVPQSIAQVLGVQESRDQSLTESLVLSIRDKPMLLTLDNCEHLVGACAELTEKLLLACANLKILTTSREPLNIAGETVWRVPSLAVPDLAHLPHPDALAEYDAIQLFVQRASALDSNWKLEGHASAVAQICARLDGIPLAIELAAARIKGLTVEQIEARLDDRFHLLVGGSRTALPRHRTLQAAIDWSYALLSEPERILLQRLSVFAGGWTLPAAEFVCADQPLESDRILDQLLALVDKSLVVAETKGTETHYRLLETIRQYAREKLVDAAERDEIRNRHLEYFLKFAQDADPKLHGPEQYECLDRLDAEHDNLRAALDWSLGEGRPEKGLQLAVALLWYWDMRNHWSEGQELTQRLLDQPGAAPKTLTRANALFVVARMISPMGDEDKRCRPYLEAAIAIARERGSDGKRLLALCLGFLGYNVFGDDPASSDSMIQEGLAIARALGDEWILGLILNWRGVFCSARQDYQAAHQAFEESRARFDSMGDRHKAAISSNSIGWAYSRENRLTQARQEFEKNLPFFRQTKDRHYIRMSLHNLGDISRKEERYDLAKRYYGEVLQIASEVGNKFYILLVKNALIGIALHDDELDLARSLCVESLALAQGLKRKNPASLSGFACIAASEKKARRATQLFACAAATPELEIRAHTSHEIQIASKRYLEMASEQLGEAAFNEVWEEGQRMTWEQVVEYALKEEPAAAAQVPTIPVYPAGLTEREVEVLRWLARGLSNQEIANKLVLSRRTVHAHLRSIYAKLDVTTRNAATRVAIESKIV